VDPATFVRVIADEQTGAVQMVRILKSESYILSVKRAGNESHLTLWTVNGTRRSAVTIPGIVTDCVVTNFALGIKKNLAFCLTREGPVVTVKIPSLNIAEGEPLCANGSSLTLSGMALTIETSNGFFRWQIE
jgi:hypothetical protein